VETRRLNEQVKRNLDRFPEEFMFRLTIKEWKNMMSQFATSSQNKRKASAPPYAFTEHGVAMLANILKSEKAIKMSIVIVKTFIHLTKQVLDYSDLAAQVKALKLHIGEHDAQLNQIYDAIENLLDEKAQQKTWENRKRIGFK
jgi:phage regulator Rha-like protein